MSAPQWLATVLVDHQTEQLWKPGGWAGDTACSCGWRMAMWTKKDFPPVHRAHVAAVVWAEFTARAQQAREDVAEVLAPHKWDKWTTSEQYADAAIAALLRALNK